MIIVASRCRVGRTIPELEAENKFQVKDQNLKEVVPAETTSGKHERIELDKL